MTEQGKRHATPIGTPAVRPPPPCASRPPRGAPLSGAVRLLTPDGAVDLVAEAVVVLGRDIACDVVLRDSLASRRHARIVVLRGAVTIEDLRSTNGVYLNGLRVPGCVLLHAGDRIVIGTSELSAFEGRRHGGRRLP